MKRREEMSERSIASRQEGRLQVCSQASTPNTRSSKMENGGLLRILISSRAMTSIVFERWPAGSSEDAQVLSPQSNVEQTEIMGLFQMTIRSLMGLVALVALGLTAFFMAIAALTSLFDEVYQPAITKLEKTWEIRATPKVIVDVFDGGIWVHPGEPGVVKATIETSSSCKNGSAEEAENALKAVDVGLTQEGDTIRILAKKVRQPVIHCMLSTSTHVHVPAGSRLVLNTNIGSISVEGTPSSVVANSEGGCLFADFEVGRDDTLRNERTPDARLGLMNGSLILETRNCGGVGPGDHVQLTQVGKVYVNGIER
jgi:hypothetical protein